VRRPGKFDGRGVDHGGMIGDGRPVGWSKLVVGLDRDATISDVSERRCDAQVVHQPMPCGVVAACMVEMMLEPACLVTPDGAACGAGWYRPEHIKVELGGSVGELKDAVDAGAGERGVELADIAVEGATLGGRRCEHRLPILLVAVEVAEVSTGLGLDSLVLGEASASVVDVAGCLADGGLVAPWPAPAEFVVEHALSVRELLFGVARRSSLRAERPPRAVALIATVGRQ